MGSTKLIAAVHWRGRVDRGSSICWGTRPSFRFLWASLKSARPISSKLEPVSHDHRFVGIRGFPWSPPAIRLDPAQLANLRDLAQRGMTLDVVSRGTTNPKPRVEAMCTSVPNPRIIIDHLAGAQGPVPTPEWGLAMRRLATCARTSVSSSGGSMTCTRPTTATCIGSLDLAACKAHFDVLMTAFRPNRLIWGAIGRSPTWVTSPIRAEALPLKFARPRNISRPLAKPYATR
jgi:L-fuconolactonase